MAKKYETPYETHELVAEVLSVHGLEGEYTGGKGPCRYYKPGDKIFFRSAEIEGTICYSALVTMMHKIHPMRVGFEYPWAKNGAIIHACPDAARPVVFEIRRAKPDEQASESRE
jgi:uncharacterized repeat protein (TIGR04076 family)